MIFSQDKYQNLNHVVFQNNRSTQIRQINQGSSNGPPMLPQGLCYKLKMPHSTELTVQQVTDFQNGAGGALALRPEAPPHLHHSPFSNPSSTLSLPSLMWPRCTSFHSQSVENCLPLHQTVPVRTLDKRPGIQHEESLDFRVLVGWDGEGQKY